MDQSEALASFSSITGADTSAAEHFLAASDWDLNTAIGLFFVDSGAQGVTQGGTSVSGPPLDTGRYGPDLGQENVPEPFEDRLPATQPQLASQHADAQDEQLQAALQASMQSAGVNKLGLVP